MADEKVRKLIRWASDDAQGIADQVAETIRTRLADGKIMGVVTCVVTADADGAGRTYEVAFSRIPVEVTLWAAEAIKRRVEQVREEPDAK